jgi:hypothetical protein
MPERMRPPSRTKPRVFFDADVLFAGSAAPSEYGASLVLLRMAEITLIDAFTCQQVVDEVERNLAAKLEDALAPFRLILSRCLQVVPNPDHQAIVELNGLGHPKDLPILAAAISCNCPWLVTFNQRHYQPVHPSVTVLNPGDLLLQVRDLLARM